MRQIVPNWDVLRRPSLIQRVVGSAESTIWSMTMPSMTKQERCDIVRDIADWARDNLPNNKMR